jgi:hypothetical protein
MTFMTFQFKFEFNKHFFLRFLPVFFLVFLRCYEGFVIYRVFLVFFCDNSDSDDC